jgi:hypothetical protein
MKSFELYRLIAVRFELNEASQLHKYSIKIITKKEGVISKKYSSAFAVDGPCAIACCHA